MTGNILSEDTLEHGAVTMTETILSEDTLEHGAVTMTGPPV